ncbi:ThiF family adenylyltransferase [Candidatus Saccharibacteria bacterium]|nr:ThiF family adenylyltransferase [Candidatus Saccharibacteria bacterium]
MTDYHNQTDIFDPAGFTWPIHIIGCGGIGGALFLPLIKLGVPEIHIWDPDVVEPHNIPAQLVYKQSDVGKLKVEAMQAFAEWMEADCKIVPHPETVTAETDLSGIVISGVDSMASRQAIWQAIEKAFWEVPLYMDGRIGGEQLQLLTVLPSDVAAVDHYKQFWLFDDSEAASLPCAARTVIHPPTVLAGLIIANLTRFVRQLEIDSSIICHLKTMQFLVKGTVQ